jgi:hypothetical protein
VAAGVSWRQEDSTKGLLATICLVNMRAVELFVVCRNEYMASEAFGLTPLHSAAGVKFASFDLRSSFRVDGEQSASNAALL